MHDFPARPLCLAEPDCGRSWPRALTEAFPLKTPTYSLGGTTSKV